MDFVTAWKASSIVLTGAFGILGLLKEFKNKETGQVTKWGRISLAGILLSSGLGVVAQLKEYSTQQKASAATAKDTLDLAQKTDQTVKDLKRILSSLDDPRVEITLSMNCRQPKYKAVCSSTKGSTMPGQKKIWQEWPKDVDGESMFFVSLNFFRAPAEADSFTVPIWEVRAIPDLVLSVKVEAESKNKSLELFRYEDTGAFAAISDSSPDVVNNSGKIVSMDDFSGSVLVITDSPLLPILRDLTPIDLTITTKKGQELHLFQFEKIVVGNEIVYKATLPDSATHY